ncbi:MAG: GNAT family N-acetyltransferase [Vicinamibacterales bacterium]
MVSERESGASTFSIRHAEPSDHEAIRNVMAGPLAVRGTLQVPFPSAERWRRRLAEPPEGYVNLVACVEDDIVGQLGLITFPNVPRRRHVGQLLMAVRDDWQGKGVGTALMAAALEFADDWLNLTRLELEVFVDNEPAIRLYKKFGFLVEGTSPSFAYRDGEFVDVLVMGRLRK